MRLAICIIFWCISGAQILFGQKTEQDFLQSIQVEKNDTSKFNRMIDLFDYYVQNDLRNLLFEKFKCQIIGHFSNLSKPNFQIYPNPTQNYLHIETGNQNWTEIQIIDNTGRILMSQAYQKTISTQHLPKGIYGIILIDSIGHRAFERFIVQ